MGHNIKFGSDDLDYSCSAGAAHNGKVGIDVGGSNKPEDPYLTEIKKNQRAHHFSLGDRFSRVPRESIARSDYVSVECPKVISELGYVNLNKVNSLRFGEEAVSYATLAKDSYCASNGAK
jgi:hypothetical protein